MTIAMGVDGFAFPDEAVTSSFAITGKKRTGKSNTSVVFCEGLYDAGLPFVVIDPKGDWFGMRSGPDGKPRGGLPIPIFGGEHGDFPLSPDAGAYMATLVVDRNLTCILDVSEFRPSELRRFVKAFLTTLYKLNRTPRLVVLEEAQEIAPQIRQSGRGDEGDHEMVAAVKRFVKLGGFKGLGTCFVTQRFQDVDKGVTTQVETIITHRTTGPQDKKAIKDWVDGTAEGAELVGELPTLRDGEALVWSPHFLGITRKVMMRRRRTFDSGATPKVGEPARVATLADIRDAGIEEAMATAIAETQSRDPKVLQARIRQLEAQLSSIEPSKPQVELVEVPTIVPVIPDVLPAELKALADVVDEMGSHLRRLTNIVDNTLGDPPDPTRLVAAGSRESAHPAGTTAGTSNGTSRRTKQAPTTQPARSGGVRVGTSTGTSTVPVPRPVAAAARESAQRTAGTALESLGKGEQKVLAVLAQWPQGRTNNELAFLAGYSAKASTLSVILAKLRRLGFVTDGQPVKLTAEGLEAAGGAQPLPTGDELLAHWMRHPRMGDGERRVLQALIDVYPNEISHEELCSMTGYSTTASTMSVVLSKLRKLGLVEKRARRVPDEFMASIS